MGFQVFEHEARFSPLRVPYFSFNVVEDDGSLKSRAGLYGGFHSRQAARDILTGAESMKLLTQSERAELEKLLLAAQMPETEVEWFHSLSPEVRRQAWRWEPDYDPVKKADDFMYIKSVGIA